MFDHLDIYTPRERWTVGLADAGLTALTLPGRLLRRRKARPAKRILLLRLERIGDLLMSLGAIRAVRAQAPDAEIDLVVGSWNAAMAGLIPEVTRVETLDVPWLARGGAGDSPAALIQPRGRLAHPTLRPRHQLRGRHQIARPDGAGRSRAARRIRAGRRRSAPHRRRSARWRPPRRRQRPVRSSSAPSISPPGRCRVRPLRKAPRPGG